MHTTGSSNNGAIITSVIVIVLIAAAVWWAVGRGKTSAAPSPAPATGQLQGTVR
jgi:hypothetical protein